MTGATIITVGALLLALFVAIAAVMMWQEAKARTVDEDPTYVIEDAIAMVVDHLEPERLSRVGRAGVRRIIEWEVFYLQGLADKKAARQGITVVAGGDELAVSYIRQQLERRGHDYAEDDVRAVLEGEAAYLADIGVIGDVVDPVELEGVATETNGPGNDGSGFAVSGFAGPGAESAAPMPSRDETVDETTSAESDAGPGAIDARRQAGSRDEPSK